MRIYKAEQQAGLDFKMNAEGNSSSFVTAKVQVRDIDKYFDGMSVADLVKSTETVQTVEQLLGQDQPDLTLIVAILVSTGWNLNDDIFTPSEVWKAKSSPLHKPMNDNHDIGKILGHIVQSRVLDKSGDVIEVTEDQSPPDEFDIEVAGVLYRQFPELRERIDEIIAKAKTGEMFVSMEAWFPDFGYGIIDPATGDVKLINRNEETAFLTKHLKTYGGTGVYEGFKVGRVLKDIIFGAQAFTDKPANPESVIKVAANKGAVSKSFVAAELNELLKGGVELVDEKELNGLKIEIAQVKLSLKTKDQEIVQLKKAVEEFKDEDSNKQIASLTTKVEELTANSTEASGRIKAFESEKSELEGKLKESNERAEKSEAEMNEIRKVETARERLSKLSAIKTVEDEKATLAELKEMTDETFAAVLKVSPIS